MQRLEESVGSTERAAEHRILVDFQVKALFFECPRNNIFQC